MHRRGFIGGLIAGVAGWFGVKQAKAETLSDVPNPVVGYWVTVTGSSKDGTSQVSRLLRDPNEDDTPSDLLRKVVNQMYLTGTGLLWAVPNKYAQPFELYSIPTATAIPQPACGEFPQGSYCVCPMYPEGEAPADWMARQASIPAEYVVRVVCPHPLLPHEGFSSLTLLRQQANRLSSLAGNPYLPDRYFVQAAANLIADKLTKHLRPHYGDDLNITITAH